MCSVAPLRRVFLWLHVYKSTQMFVRAASLMRDCISPAVWSFLAVMRFFILETCLLSWSVAARVASYKLIYPAMGHVVLRHSGPQCIIITTYSWANFGTQNRGFHARAMVLSLFWPMDHIQRKYHDGPLCCANISWTSSRNCIGHRWSHIIDCTVKVRHIRNVLRIYGTLCGPLKIPEIPGAENLFWTTGGPERLYANKCNFAWRP